MDGIDAEDVAILKTPSYLNLMRHAISFADGVIVAQENASQELIDFARENKKPFLGLQTEETYADAYSAFYDEVLLGEPVAEMAE
jgi:starch synthase